MKENSIKNERSSIEEDIKIAERFIKSIKTDKEYKKEGWHGYFNKEIVELARILEHILSDYKRVLKENESLQKTYDDCYCKYKHYKQFESISIQKVKDKIEELNRKIDNGGKTYGRYGGCVINSENIMKLQNQIEALQELLEKE